MASVSTMTPCRLWGAGTTADGYGKLRIGGKTWRAHRWAWTLVHGPIPEGMVVMHLCDNPACVNLDHLRLGTQAENVADMKAKGRTNSAPSRALRLATQRAITHCPQGHPYDGENLSVRRGRRHCRACARIHSARYKQKRRALAR